MSISLISQSFEFSFQVFVLIFFCIDDIIVIDALKLSFSNKNFMFDLFHTSTFDCDHNYVKYEHIYV